MIAIAGGLGAALLWAAANVASSRSSRLIGPSSTVAWVMAIGLVSTAPLAPASGPVPPIGPALAFWLVAGGLGSVIGLLFLYRGLRIGKVGPVLALGSTEGAIAALMAVAAGERLTVPVAVMLGVVAVGVAVVAFASGGTAEATAAIGNAEAQPETEPTTEPGDGPGPRPDAHHAAGPDHAAERKAALFGVAAAIAFAFSIFGTAQAGLSLPVVLAIMPARIAGTALFFIPLALTGRLRITRRAAPLLLLSGLSEVLGNVAYVLGARESIAISAVLASQYAAVGAVAAFFLFRERLSLGQRSGVVAIAIGVALLTAFRG